MTKNERKRKLKRNFKKTRIKMEQSRGFLRYLPVIAVIGAVILIFHSCGGSSSQASEESETKETAEATPTEAPATPTPTPLPDISLNDGILENEISDYLDTLYGEWSVYVKNLNNDESFTINNQEMYSASLIKLFILENTYANLHTLVQNSASNGGSESYGYEYIMGLLTDMITISDNDAYNTLVALRSEKNSFTDGALIINEEIQETYSGTGVYATLLPAAMDFLTTGLGQNHTTVEDCGKLLESIYRGTCVSEDASEAMLELLLNQETTYKIPAGVPDGIEVANKTGETDASDHDAAIVFGPTTDYILCIMSQDETESGNSISSIVEISSMVYEYLNP